MTDLSDSRAQQLIYAALGNRVRDARKEADISQDLLSKGVGLSRSSIANIERGKQAVTLYALYRIAKALDTDIAELLPDWSQLDEAVQADPLLEVDPDLIHGFEQTPVASQWLARLSQGSEKP